MQSKERIHDYCIIRLKDLFFLLIRESIISSVDVWTLCDVDCMMNQTDVVWNYLDTNCRHHYPAISFSYDLSRHAHNNWGNQASLSSSPQNPQLKVCLLQWST